MAEAVSSQGADDAGVSNFHYNPASNATLKSPEVSVMGQRGIAEDNFGTLSAGFPTIFGTFSGSLSYYSLGDLDLINSQGITSTVNAQRDVGFAVNYGEELFGILGTGITLKYLNSKLVDAFSANSFAFDAGVQSRLEDGKLALGLSVTNLGSDVKYIETQEPLPVTLRVGGSYKVGLGDSRKAVFALDVVKERESDFKKFVGVEVLYNEMISLRGGYKIGQDQGDVNAGLGFQVNGLQINYAVTSAGKLGLAHSVSAEFKFGRSLRGERFPRAGEERERRAREIQHIRSASKSRRAKIAVLGLNALGTGANTASLLSDELFLDFCAMPKVFDVLSSEKVRETISQSGTDLSQCTDVACLKSVGQKLGVDKVVTGLLSKSQGLYTLTVQMVNVETGAIEVTEAARASSFDDMETEIKNIVNAFAK